MRSASLAHDACGITSEEQEQRCFRAAATRRERAALQLKTTRLVGDDRG